MVNHGSLAFFLLGGCWSSRPHADEVEAMVAQFLAAADVDWDAPEVKSGINVPLWHQHHARHCKCCSDTEISPKCLS